MNNSNPQSQMTFGDRSHSHRAKSIQNKVGPSNLVWKATRKTRIKVYNNSWPMSSDVKHMHPRASSHNSARFQSNSSVQIDRRPSINSGPAEPRKFGTDSTSVDQYRKPYHSNRYTNQYKVNSGKWPVGVSQDVASSNFMRAVQKYGSKPNNKALRRKKPKLEL